MPGIIGGLVSAIAITTTNTQSGFPADYFPGAGTKGDLTRQSMAQIYALVVTLAISLASGNLFGWICKHHIFSPPTVLFKDDDHFIGVVDRYNDEQRNMGDDVPVDGAVNASEVEL